MPDKKIEETRGPIILRLLVASIVWLAVSGISLHVAWRNAGEADAARQEQYITQLQLEDIDAAITQFKQHHGATPHSIEDVLSRTNLNYWRLQGSNVDGWKRPFAYSYDGTNFLVTSYGRDGKRGGIGLDCDLTNKDWKPKQATPTFAQFLFYMPTRGMINTCIVCGGLAFLLAIFTIRVPHLHSPELFPIVLQIVATIIGALIVTVFISALHIPSGH
jgi:hypothetical protein